MTGKETDGSPLIGTRLPGGLFVMLGDDQYTDHGDLRYPGRVGIKYGRDKKDWVRMSYGDAVALVRFLQENRSFVNERLAAERERQIVDEL